MRAKLSLPFIHVQSWDTLNIFTNFLTKSEDGTSQSHDDLSVLEHLSLRLELHRTNHQDDDPSHQEGDAEVEEGQFTS